MTFASIVEGEARADDERETIAGVYHNRLRIGMALQADPTVQYAIFLATGKRKPRLFTKDYQFRSPYNTYLNPGLPPGPVNSPSRRSIEASLYPARVPYLYFVAGPDGRHVFSRTYDEHLRAIAKVRERRGGGAGRRQRGIGAAVILRHTCGWPARRHRSGRGSRDTATPTPPAARHRPARPPAAPRRSRCRAVRPPAAASRRNPSGPSAAPASAFVPVRRQGPMPQ